jgi:deoxyribose-phosphate aldolase
VIVESGNLSIKEQEKANAIVLDSGAQVIKTSTGYGHGDDIIKKLTTVAMWKNLGGLKIKASGGIKDLTTAQSFLEAGAEQSFLEAGADIIGTSSGVAIAEEHEAETGKN